MLALYRLFVWLLRVGIGLAAWWNPKAALWVSGRKDLYTALKETLSEDRKIIWVHCASAGELEQGKPVIDLYKKNFPGHQVLITFFSPSGFEAGTRYKGADYVFYMPLDTAGNATRFVDIVQPELAIFIKYDFWFYHLKALNDRQIPVLLVSSIFRKGQLFFRWYGSFYRGILQFFTWIFVQDEHSIQLLQAIKIRHCSLGGDTRFDRVSSITENRVSLDGLDSFVASGSVLVAGSTWLNDEILLAEVLPALPSHCKLIIAPHEVTAAHLLKLKELFNDTILYSEIKRYAQQRVLLINNTGLLSQLYQYATIAYIGGGFNRSGIHNTLEAAAWGKPVVIGPNFQKFAEARTLVNNGGAFSIASAKELRDVVLNLLDDTSLLHHSGETGGAYVQANKGASQKVITYIQENRLLTMA